MPGFGCTGSFSLHSSRAAAPGAQTSVTHTHKPSECIGNIPAGVCLLGRYLNRHHRSFLYHEELLDWLHLWHESNSECQICLRGKFRNVPSTSLANVFHHRCLSSVQSEVLHEAPTVPLKSQTVIWMSLVSLCPSAGTGILSSQPEENPHWWNANMV